MPDSTEHGSVPSDERQRRANALHTLAERMSIAPGAASVATPLREAVDNRKRRPLIWGSIALMVVVIIAVVVATIGHGAASGPSANGERSVIQFPLTQIACPESESWSPDGKELAVVGYVNCGFQDVTQTGINPVVALFNVASGRIVTTFSLQTIIARAIPAGSRVGDVGKPVWSSDGSLIGVPYFYTTSANQGVYGMVALGVKGSTLVIAPTSPMAKVGVTYDHYSTSFVMPPLTVRFDLTTRSATPVTPPPAYAYSWSGADALTPASLSDRSGASKLPASISGSLTYLCSTSAGASYLLSAGSAAWSPDDRYFYSTLGAYGVVSGANPTSGVTAPACTASLVPAGWQPLTAPLKGLEGAERDFQKVDNGNTLMFATAPGASRIAVVESDASAQGTYIRVYDGATGARQAQLSLQQLINAHHIHQRFSNASYLQQIAWSPDGRSLALLDNQDLAIIIVGPTELP